MTKKQILDRLVQIMDQLQSEFVDDAYENIGQLCEELRCEVSPDPEATP